MNKVTLNQQPLAFSPSRLSPYTYSQAVASADPRYQMKGLDRAGFSRGAGQQQQAGIQGAQSFTKGIADAYSRQLANQTMKAQARMQDEQGREKTAQQLGGMQEQDAYAGQLAGLNRQATLMNFFNQQNNALRGLIT